ncbi:MAG: polyribonucleotide nucleotidyltransferase [Thermomicrobiales bacterium]
MVTTMPAEIRDKVTTLSLDVGGRQLTLEVGLLAELAHGSVMVRYGDSMLLSGVVGEREPKEGMDFFPLTVDYEEKMYAAGKIPGGFIKREGRPTEAAILAARLTDRPLRPLFPKGYRAEVQVINTVMSADQENDPDILSIIGASAALTISQIPFNGPVGACRIGRVEGEFVVNPTFAQREEGDLDIVVAGTATAIMMVEGEASEVPEADLLEAFDRAHVEIKRIVDLQLQLQKIRGVEKWPVTVFTPDASLVERVEQMAGEDLRAANRNADKTARSEATKALKRDIVVRLGGQEGGETVYTAKQVADVFDSLLKREVREDILSEGLRPDGRGPDEVRSIWSMVGYLPRAHGSAIFTRGQTQAVTVVTLGSTAEEQRLDSISPEDRKRYIHHYNFPPFSVGEVRRLRGASRRDIGHGALAERALMAVIPSAEAFPYTLRLVSEVVSSNGSTSMASVCGSTMALMDAGVPITRPVAGVAMGLVTDPATGRFTVLTDIQGVEDALGDMDFKVAGTSEGITAIQMDIKVEGITADVMRQALEQAHVGRQHILAKMLETIATPRETMSPYAPMVKLVKVNPEKIGSIIGPGGKNIRALQEETGTKIDISDDGTVAVSSSDAAGVEAAIARITGMTREIKIERGEVYTGKVVSIMPFGAFVELVPGKDGLVHISEISEDPAIRVDRVEDVLKMGDEITVMVIDVAPNGKVSLSRRAAISGILPEPKADRGPRRDGPGGPPRGDFGRGDGPRRDARPPMRESGSYGGDRPMIGSAPDEPRQGDQQRPVEQRGFEGRPVERGGSENRPADSRRRPSFGDGDPE